MKPNVVCLYKKGIHQYGILPLNHRWDSKYESIIYNTTSSSEKYIHCCLLTYLIKIVFDSFCFIANFFICFIVFTYKQFVLVSQASSTQSQQQ